MRSEIGGVTVILDRHCKSRRAISCYSDPAVTTSELRAFYADMCRQFPDMDALTAEELDAGPGLDVVCQDI